MKQKSDTTAVVAETALEAPRVAHKPTTAATFFGKKKESAKPTAPTATSTTKTTTVNKTSTSKGSSKTTTVPSMFQRAASSTATSLPSKKPKATAQQDEKENNKRPKSVGNADDFVGDEEESDDEEVVVQKPAVVRGRVVPKDDEVMVMDDVEEEKEEKNKAKPTIYGAMDDFAKPKEAAPEADAPKRRRRRKRLIEKTTMDKSGYIHTETQEIWEDIPTDEEEEVEAPKKAKPAVPVPSRPKKKVVKTSGMKQGDIKGFFSAKKK